MHPIRKRREELGLTVEQAAVKSGLSFSMWTKMERGERTPSFHTARAAAPVLKWTVAELYAAIESAHGARDHSSSQATRTA